MPTLTNRLNSMLVFNLPNRGVPTAMVRYDYDKASRGVQARPVTVKLCESITLLPRERGVAISVEDAESPEIQSAIRHRRIKLRD